MACGLRQSSQHDQPKHRFPETFQKRHRWRQPVVGGAAAAFAGGVAPHEPGDA